jgi:hypothetical protein
MKNYQLYCGHLQIEHRISCTQETPASITGVIPFGQEPVQMLYNLTAPFLLTFLHLSGVKQTHKIYTIGFAKHHEVIHLPCKLPLAIHMQHAMITITLHSLNTLVVQQQ